MILGAEGGSHLGVVWKQSEPDDAPVATGGRQLVRVQREVRAMEAADSDVNDARRKPRPVVRGNGDPPQSDLGQVVLRKAYARWRHGLAS